MILEANHIHFTYPAGDKALVDASFTVSPGERIALLGVNGAGKSTLFQILNGSLKPGSGTLLLHGTPVIHDRKGLLALRRAVGLVMQDPDDQLFAATVEEDVSFGPSNMGLAEADIRARVAEALAALGISGLAKTPTHALSFGQRKRVAIAGILAMRPAMLLLDEPTAGLDPSGIEDLMQALSRLTEQGTAIVIATHDMDLAWSWAERVAVFSGRSIALQGDPETVFADPERLKSYGLRPPMVHEMGLALLQAGLIDRLPKSVAEVALRLKRPVTVSG